MVSRLFIFLWIYTQSVGLLGRVIGPSQGLYLNTGQHKHRINAHTTSIHSRSWIRTHDHSVRASEDSSCLRPLGYLDRHSGELPHENNSDEESSITKTSAVSVIGFCLLLMVVYSNVGGYLSFEGTFCISLQGSHIFNGKEECDRNVDIH
jgi:hypothetical protein